MWQTGYPLHVMHGYAIAADEALEFARLVHRVDVETLSNIEVVTNARRPLLAYAALVLEYVIRIGKPRQIVFSALGVREGLLYSLLKQKDKEKDALIEAARGLNQLRSRSPRHGEELIDWTNRFMASSGLDEPGEERRLRHAACLLGRYRLAGASRLSRRAIAQHHRPRRVHRRSIIPAAPIWRSPFSTATSDW